MKKIIQYALLLVLMVTAFESEAQIFNSLDNDKVYLTSPSADVDAEKTYEMKFKFPNLQQELQEQPNFISIIEQKWSAHKDIASLSIDQEKMTVSFTMNRNVSDSRVLELLKRLNPGIQQVVPK